MALHVAVIWVPSDVSISLALRQMEAAGAALPRLLLVDLMTLNNDDFVAFFEAMALDPIPVMITMAQRSDDFFGPTRAGTSGGRG